MDWSGYSDHIFMFAMVATQSSWYHKKMSHCYPVYCLSSEIKACD